MKKLSLVLATALFVGCATNDVTPKVDAKQELQILKKYGNAKKAMENEIPMPVVTHE